MFSSGFLAALAGAALSLAGLALLILAWRRRKEARGPLILGGWALMAASFWPWTVFGGWDRGPAIAIALISLAAFAVVMRNGLSSGRAREAAADDDEPSPAQGQRIPWLRRTFVVLLAGPIAGVSAAVLGLVLFTFGPREAADRLALSAFLMPVLWGALTAWVVSDPKLLRKTLGVVGAGAVGGLALVVATAVQA